EQHLVDVAHEPVEVAVAHLGGAQLRVLTGLSHTAPAVPAPHQVGTDDHAGMVVLEALCGVDATHLVESRGVRGPQGGWRGATHRPVAAQVPRSAPAVDLYVVDQ